MHRTYELQPEGAKPSYQDLVPMSHVSDPKDVFPDRHDAPLQDFLNGWCADLFSCRDLVDERNQVGKTITSLVGQHARCGNFIHLGLEVVKPDETDGDIFPRKVLESVFDFVARNVLFHMK